MKKIIFVILIIFISFISSCSPLKKDDTEQELNHYEFLDKETIYSMLSTFDIVIKYDNSTYEFMENESGFFFSNDDNSYLLSKDSDIKYSLDISNSQKQVRNITTSISNLKYTLVDYLSAHYEIKDSLYILEENKQTVAGISCNVYSKESSDKLTKESYYVTDDGFCFKRILTSPKKTVYWEVVKYSLNKTIIDIDMSDYFNFETTIPYTYYTSWPTSYLASLIPEFKYGNFVTASDNGSDCTIYYNSVSLANFNEYVSKVRLVGFSGEDVSFDGNQIYKCNLKNTDDVFIELAFDSGQYQIRIEIYTSKE